MDDYNPHINLGVKDGMKLTLGLDPLEQEEPFEGMLLLLRLPHGGELMLAITLGAEEGSWTVEPIAMRKQEGFEITMWDQRTLKSRTYFVKKLPEE